MSETSAKAKIGKQIAFWRKALSIDPRWQINVEFVDDDGNCDGAIYLAPHVWQATIEISRGIVDSEPRLSEVVLHEMLELADWETATIFWSLSKYSGAQRTLNEIYEAARNRFIMSLVPLLARKHEGVGMTNESPRALPRRPRPGESEVAP